MSSESPGADVHALIHALQPKEKRYFKLFASRTGQQSEKKYMLLYDFLVKQPAWSEKDVRVAFAQETFIKQLNVACKYLYELLLASLRGYDQDRTFNSEGSRRLDEIVLLSERKLYAQCRRRIHLTIRFAERLDLPLLHAQVLEHEIRLIRDTPHKDNWKPLCAAIAKTEVLLQQLALEGKLDGLYSKLYALEKWPSATVPAEKAALAEEIAQDPVLALDPTVLGFDAKILLYNTRLLIAKQRKNGEALFDIQSDKLACWSHFPRRMEVEPERYLKTMTSYVESAIDAERFEKVPATLRKMKLLISKSSSLATSYNLLYLHLELRYYLNIHALEKAFRFTHDILPHLPITNEQAPVTGQLTLYTNAALVHFLMSSWEGCLEWLTRLAPFLKGGLRSGVTLWVGPLRIMACYSANRFDELEMAIRNWSRNPDAGTLAAPILACFSALLDADSDAVEHALLARLQAAIVQHAIAPDVAALIHRWAQSRLDNRPLRGYYPDSPD
jgi:hypothetical protein